MRWTNFVAKLLSHSAEPDWHFLSDWRICILESSRYIGTLGSNKNSEELFFWFVTLRSLLIYRRFREMYCLNLQGRRISTTCNQKEKSRVLRSSSETHSIYDFVYNLLDLLFNSEDWDCTSELLEYRASHCRKLCPSASPMWVPRIQHDPRNFDNRGNKFCISLSSRDLRTLCCSIIQINYDTISWICGRPHFMDDQPITGPLPTYKTRYIKRRIYLYISVLVEGSEPVIGVHPSLRTRHCRYNTLA
jgi:hypothetical protein